METPYIIGGARSYIGVENGMYKNIPAEILGAKVLKNVLEKYKKLDVDMIIAGNAAGAGGNIARLMALEAGLSESIPAFTIDLQCASGLESIAVATAKIQSGGQSSWYKTAKFLPGEHRQTAMLEGAEKTAVSEGITRKMLDKWVLQSHRLAKETREKGILNDVIVEIADGCDKDEGIRDRMGQRLLDRLPCVLESGNVITAANACLTNDGAAFVVLGSERYLKKHGIKPLAEVNGVAEVGVTPDESPRAAIAAVSKLLEKNHLDYHDVSVYECNEAFAVIDELFARTYPDVIDRYNIFGGALAYGHPYGASGGIIVLHALKALELIGSTQCSICKADGKYAVCSIAAAGGIGTAILIKKADVGDTI